MSSGSAPRASLTAISRVRRAVACATTPYTPTAVSTIAMSEKAPSTNSANRVSAAVSSTYDCSDCNA
jgi:hypothetical protein